MVASQIKLFISHDFDIQKNPSSLNGAFVPHIHYSRGEESNRTMFLLGLGLEFPVVNPSSSRRTHLTFKLSGNCHG